MRYWQYLNNNTIKKLQNEYVRYVTKYIFYVFNKKKKKPMTGVLYGSCALMILYNGTAFVCGSVRLYPIEYVRASRSVSNDDRRSLILQNLPFFFFSTRRIILFYNDTHRNRMCSHSKPFLNRLSENVEKNQGNILALDDFWWINTDERDLFRSRKLLKFPISM